MATIDKMQKAKRFPIPEKLLHMPPNFELQIDSLMHAAYNSDSNDELASQQPSIGAPCNSWESNEEMDFDSSDEETNQKRKAANKDQDIVITRKKNKMDVILAETKAERTEQERLQSIQIHRNALTLHGYNMEVLQTYPHNLESDEVPTFVLSAAETGKDTKSTNKRPLRSKVDALASFEEIQANLLEEFKEKTYFPTPDHLQVFYEHLCKTFDCTPLPIL